MHIQGNYNSMKARMITIELKKCNEFLSGGCKSDAEIMEFFRGKYLLIL